MDFVGLVMRRKDEEISRLAARVAELEGLAKIGRAAVEWRKVESADLLSSDQYVDYAKACDAYIESLAGKEVGND